MGKWSVQRLPQSGHFNLDAYAREQDERFAPRKKPVTLTSGVNPPNTPFAEAFKALKK